MTLKDFIMEGLIKDEEKIRILRPICGAVHTIRGNWFQDHILDLHDMEIAEVQWSREKGWTVLLADQEAEPADLPFV